ncbi:MAG: VOC family protein [Deltaproteobacteria bacterium]|nr:VOC family protein [Deltaproteobacteria bacterium]
MAASEELGILGVDSWHYFVRQPERSRTFYERGFGWREVARAGEALVAATGQRSTVYQSGDVRVVVSTPESDRCRAGRYLKRHPAGVGSVTFAVEDIERTWRFLAERGGTPIHDIAETREGGGRFRHFSITTPIGDVAFRFVERTDYVPFAPGFEAVEPPASYVAPAFGFKKVDHITNNAPTMAPVKLWFEHVLGFEQCWEIEFHTNDVKQGARKSGTGLKSVVMWDPRSGIKFPINEPLQPFFKEGQINTFVEDNAGAGVQHIALEVEDCVGAVRTLRQQQVGFLRTPGSYYDAAPSRLAQRGVDTAKIAHRLEELRELGVLIDGKPENLYLIQIFLQDAATLYAEPGAGPFFYELIQRCGDPGFGEGNFRALFEAIERDQVTA